MLTHHDVLNPEWLQSKGLCEDYIVPFVLESMASGEPVTVRGVTFKYEAHDFKPGEWLHSRMAGAVVESVEDSFHRFSFSFGEQTPCKQINYRYRTLFRGIRCWGSGSCLIFKARYLKPADQESARLLALKPIPGRIINLDPEGTW